VKLEDLVIMRRRRHWHARRPDDAKRLMVCSPHVCGDWSCATSDYDARDPSVHKVSIQSWVLFVLTYEMIKMIRNLTIAIASIVTNATSVHNRCEQGCGNIV